MWQQICLSEFVVATAGQPRFLAKTMPTQTARGELQTDSSRLIGLFCLADDTDAFILQNRFVSGDVWSPELGDYADPVWETVVLRSTVDAFTAIPTGPGTTHRIEWAGGLIQWAAVAVDPLTYLGQPVILGVGSALAYTTSNHGSPIEFLSELELPSSTAEWRLERSPSPTAFILARHAAIS